MVNSEDRGEIRNLWLMTKKRSSEILADENQEILKFGKFSTESENFSETGGNLKQRGKCIIASEGMDTPDGR